MILLCLWCLHLGPSTFPSVSGIAVTLLPGMMAPVFGSATARLFRCILPVLCVALFILLFLNDGFAAQVYDRQTLLFIRIMVRPLHGLVFRNPLHPCWCQQPVIHIMVCSIVAPVNMEGEEEVPEYR